MRINNSTQVNFKGAIKLRYSQKNLGVLNGVDAKIKSFSVNGLDSVVLRCNSVQDEFDVAQHLAANGISFIHWQNPNMTQAEHDYLLGIKLPTNMLY